MIVTSESPSLDICHDIPAQNNVFSENKFVCFSVSGDPFFATNNLKKPIEDLWHPAVTWCKEKEIM